MALSAPAVSQTGESRPPRGRSKLRARLGDYLISSHAILMYLFLYIPILILVVFSFNDSRFLATWSGASLRWYGEMLNDDQVGLALWNSLFVAVVSTVISTILGTLAAMAMERYRFTGQMALDAVLYLPIIIPEIAMAIMLLVWFNLTGIGFTPWRVDILGIRLSVPISVIIGHVAFNISFVTVVVRARLAQMDRTLEEAAQDLFANPWKTFTRVTLPMMMPGIVAGALLAFTLSLDDFIITFFTSGAGFNTLTVYVYGLVKRGITPKINAISTVMVAFSLALVLLSRLLQRRGGKAEIGLDLP